jgi:hypothetical protein
MINVSDISLNNIENLNLGGRGGKEKQIGQLLTKELGWTRKSGQLYDFVNNVTNIKVEIKKQGNQQWFDPTKYAKLTDSEKLIDIVFILIGKGGIVDTIFSISTQDFVSRTWEQDYLIASYNFKNSFPKSKAQIKYPVKVRDFFRDNSDIVNLIYKK